MQSKAKKTEGRRLQASLPLVYMRINQVPKYMIYSYTGIILLLLPIPVNSA